MPGEFHDPCFFSLLLLPLQSTDLIIQFADYFDHTFSKVLLAIISLLSTALVAHRHTGMVRVTVSRIRAWVRVRV